ncbi:glycosyltransferase family 2 protein [Nocardioides sp. 616]|uniref:glycosyltransferase family 2 protein n=1 Tax=Nocardioides sp. 616 TaxID=2268090 RepID=UPI0013B3E2FB|nr:glycosyltransferase family 2 protein [Nocardioides sp. 616]
MDTSRDVVTGVMLNWRDTSGTQDAVQRLLADPIVSFLVVVDNESDGSLRAALAHWGPDRLEILEQADNLGFSSGMNVGLRRALELHPSTPILAINNDAHMANRASLKELLNALNATSKPAVVAPRIVLPDGSAGSTGGRLYMRSLRTSDDLPVGSPPDYLTWACVLIHPDVFRQHGLLSEKFFMYWEDVEFGLRLKRSGVPLIVVHTSAVVHAVSSSHGRAGVRIQLYSALGLVRLAILVGPAAIPGAVYRIAGRMASALSHGDIGAAKAILAGVRVGLFMSTDDSAVAALKRSGHLNSEATARGKASS